MLKIAYIKQISKGKWRVLSKKGRNLGTYSSKEEAEKRLKQVEFFKHWPFHPVRKKKAVQNLYNKIVFGEENLPETEVISSRSETSLAEATSTFSAEMRELRKNNPEKVINFLKQFNISFQNALRESIENPEQAALLETKLATK
jgi:hypothetical protein